VAPSGLRFVPLGVGNAFSALHYTCCLLIGAEGRWMVLDCPHPLRKMLREGGAAAGLELDLEDLDAALLTHLHADHASGIEDFGYYCAFAAGRPAHLVTHPQVLERLWPDSLSASMDTDTDATCSHTWTVGMERWFRVTTLTEEEPLELGPFRIECHPTRHPIPTYAYRITAGGRTLSMSSDTYFVPELIEWLAEADLVIHEAGPSPHTPYEKLAALPEELRARMRLIHLPDGFDREGSRIEPLVQGKLYEV